MSDKQIRDIQQWLRNTVTNNKCGCCGSENWDLNKQLIASPSIKVSKTHLPSPDFSHGAEFVLLYCRSCGNVKLFSARKILDF